MVCRDTVFTLTVPGEVGTPVRGCLVSAFSGVLSQILAYGFSFSFCTHILIINQKNFFHISFHFLFMWVSDHCLLSLLHRLVLITLVWVALLWFLLANNPSKWVSQWFNPEVLASFRLLFYSVLSGARGGICPLVRWRLFITALQKLTTVWSFVHADLMTPLSWVCSSGTACLRQMDAKYHATLCIWTLLL